MKKYILTFLSVFILSVSFAPISFAFSISPSPVADLDTDITLSDIQIGYYYVIFTPDLTNYCYSYFAPDNNDFNGSLNSFSCNNSNAVEGSWSILQLTNNPNGDDYTTLKASDRFASEQFFDLTSSTSTTTPPVATSTASTTTSIDSLNFGIAIIIVLLFIIIIGFIFNSINFKTK